jgi:hypothetical protein
MSRDHLWDHSFRYRPRHRKQIAALHGEERLTGSRVGSRHEAVASEAGVVDSFDLYGNPVSALGRAREDTCEAQFVLMGCGTGKRLHGLRDDQILVVDRLTRQVVIDPGHPPRYPNRLFEVQARIELLADFTPDENGVDGLLPVCGP